MPEWGATGQGDLFLAAGGTQDDAGSADGEEGAVGNDTALAVAKYLIVYKGARVAGAIAQD